MKKILVSSGFGAGWSTWNSGEIGKFMLTYQPIIDFLEAGNSFTDEDCHSDEKTNRKEHPLLLLMMEEIRAKFGEDYTCVLGADDLQVETVYGPFRINEYDGSESIEEKDNTEWESADE
jgi:hypothetical protein